MCNTFLTSKFGLFLRWHFKKLSNLFQLNHTGFLLVRDVQTYWVGHFLDILADGGFLYFCKRLRHKLIQNPVYQYQVCSIVEIKYMWWNILDEKWNGTGRTDSEFTTSFHILMNQGRRTRTYSNYITDGVCLGVIGLNILSIVYH